MRRFLFLLFSSVWCQLLLAQNLTEISAKYSLKTLPNEFVGVVDQQGYLINKPESVLAFSLEGDYSSEDNRGIPKFLGIERGLGIWFDELYRCKQLRFFIQSGKIPYFDN